MKFRTETEVEIKLIDRKAAKAKRNKMESNNILIHSLLENAEKKDSQQSTDNRTKVWKSWASENRSDKRIEESKPEALNKIHEEF